MRSEAPTGTPAQRLRVRLRKQKCAEIRVRYRVPRFKLKPVRQNSLVDGPPVVSSASRKHLQP